jgi:hypothetical protein
MVEISNMDVLFQVSAQKIVLPLVSLGDLIMVKKRTFHFFYFDIRVS